MKFLEYLDRVGQRRLERYRIAPPRPRDTRMAVGVLFFLGYYTLVFAILRSGSLPAENATLVRDAMLVLGPVVGAIGQALFRTDARDEAATANTGEALRGMRVSAEATKAAAESMPPALATVADTAAQDVAGAAQDRADEIADEHRPTL